MRARTNLLTTSTSARSFALLAALVFAACGGGIDESPSFVPGDPAKDAVMRLALLGPTVNTVQVTVKNASSQALGEGLIAITPWVPVNGSASAAAFYSYIQGTSSVTQAGTAAGLTMNVSGFTVPPLAANTSQTILIGVPPNSELIYLAKVANSTTDFVMSPSMMSIPNGATGTLQAGYSLSSNGGIAVGNQTTGATPLISVIAFDVASNCTATGTMTQPLRLLSDDFKTVKDTSAWPMNSGYDAEFNGDWYTDGITARVWNPLLGDPAAPRAVTTGFVKFMAICPTDQATITLTAHIDTQLVSTSSDATMVLYYFDASNALIRVDANAKIGKGNYRDTTLFESPVPLNARRIAIAPMEHLAVNETGNVFFSSIAATYAPKGTYLVTAVANDTLATVTSTSDKQPLGWLEFGGDYYVLNSVGTGWTTLGNPTWPGFQVKPLPLDTGITKRFTLPKLTAGDTLDARVFAAATFTDASSFARIRLQFNNSAGTVIGSFDGDRLSQSSYGSLELLGVVIPSTAVTVDVILNAYLGKIEASSFYAQNLTVNKKTLLLK